MLEEEIDRIGGSIKNVGAQRAYGQREGSVEV